MSVLALGQRKRWSPPISATVDRGHLLAAGLISCVIPSGSDMFDVAQGVKK